MKEKRGKKAFCFVLKVKHRNLSKKISKKLLLVINVRVKTDREKNLAEEKERTKS